VLTDYHMHLVDDETPYTDESFTLEHARRYVDAARSRGIDEIAFTDHVFRFRQAREWFDHDLWRAGAVSDLDAYHGAVTAAREAGLPVKAGLEVDYFAGREPQIRELLDARTWDVLLASVHWVAGLAMDWELAPVWERHSTAEVWDLYVDAVCSAAASGLFDVMAHPDLAKVFGHRPDPKPIALYERIADGFAASGVCAEVSTAGYGRALGELYPDPELLALFRRREVPVTLASDAHAPEQVGRHFDRALAALHEAGYRTITAFDGREPRQVPFDA
jgi:histidinol-phosphatase (PHP family)